MQKDSQSLREELYRVIQHYAELSKLAQKGEVDPIGQIGRIIKSRFPYLLILVRDLLPLMESDQMTYDEALFSIFREVQQFSDLPTLLDSRSEIEKIESEERIFLYTVKWLDSNNLLRPSVQDIEPTQKYLQTLNKKYRERYAPDADATTMLIPCYFVPDQTETENVTIARMAEVVKRALHELLVLMLEREPRRRFTFFGRGERREEIQKDMVRLAWFLFRCGYTVDRIATGYYKDRMCDFLNEKLLEHLISSADRVKTMSGLSGHLATMCLMDFSNIYEIPSDYCGLGDSKTINRQVKLMRAKNRRGADVLARISELHDVYSKHPTGRTAQRFLAYRYHSSFGDYHGERRYRDPKGALAIQVYKPLVDADAVRKRTEEDLEQSGRLFSTKTRDEMASLIEMISHSLQNPERVRGKKVKILGDISSGAMGKVSIGIYRDRIVALKTVKSSMASTMGNPVELLTYEAAMHERAQPVQPEQHPSIVEYYGLIEQDGERILVNGYYPNDSLTLLVERNWNEKYRPPFATTSKISLATLEVILNQMLECLRIFRERGVVHRDLKTDNILYMVDEHENVNRIKIIDFGVALADGPGAPEDLFRGKVVGTFSYMAPEQARGKSVFPSDLYSAGAIFTVLLTGKLPMVFPRTKTRQDLVKQILRIEKAQRPKLTDLNPWLKKNSTLEHVAATVEQMLDLDPLRRPTIEECQEAFDGVFDHLGDEKYSIYIFYQN